MKTKKLSFCKRIFICLCCTVLLSSSIFISYSMTVYAADDYDLKDCAEDIIGIALLIGNICMIPASGGLTALSALAIAQGLLQGSDSVVNIYNYVTDNGDGTYTISPDFVQAVMDAAKRLEEQGFSDTDVTYQSSGSIYTVKGYGTYNWHNQIQTFKISGDTNKRAAACMEYSGTDDVSKVPYYTCYYIKLSDDGKSYVWLGFPYVRENGSSGTLSSYCLSTFATSIPLFSSLSAAVNYVVTGSGYKDAENYRAKPLFRRHSSYTPTYSGGSVTVNRTVIEKITQKITEVDADGTKTDDEKIEILQEYIRTGVFPGTGGGGGTGGGDKDYDDNKDLPAGTELTDTNSWLKKIYLKVCQIFNKLQPDESEGTGGNILQESLDAVLAKLDDLNTMLKKYLSEITGDLDDIKGQLANMSEQEFEQKSDSFLGEVMDAFSEISEVVKTKFPFSIPNDLRIFLSKIAPAPPEAEAALYLNDTSGVSFYSGEHGGSGTTDGETNPPGGGGASCPGSGFIGVEHGGGGASRDPVEMREAPVFRLPIVIERYGIEEYIIIDMSPFDPLSRFSRSFFTIIFIVCLFNLTFKVIGMWGDLVG